MVINKAASEHNVDPAKLEEHVRYLSEECYPRNYQFPDKLDCAADYILSHFKKAGGKVFEQVYMVEGHPARNIIIRFGPEDGERIVVGAHYDVYKLLPGANDDASGIAALIELAYLLEDDELPIMVELAAFTLEEPPFYMTDYMGSAVHASQLAEQGVDVRLMIAVDEIGHFSDDPGSQTLPDLKIPV